MKIHNLIFLFCIAYTSLINHDNAPVVTPLKNLPSDVLGQISGFLSASESFALHSLFKYAHQPINPLLRSELNPLEYHAITDPQNLILLIARSPEFSKLFGFFLRNPSLGNIHPKYIMCGAVSTGKLQVVDLFANYLNVPVIRYIEETGFFLGINGKKEEIDQFFTDPRVMSKKESAGNAALRGSCLSGNINAAKWLLNQVDPTSYANQLFETSLNSGRVEIAQVLSEDPRVDTVLRHDLRSRWESLQFYRARSSNLWIQLEDNEKLFLLVAWLLYCLFL